ncbi:MAG: prolipoprotein diacylglyceryl transferase [Candidatus Omnitrophota bacterium]
MIPVFFRCRFFSIYSYGVFVGLAFLVASFLLLKDAKRKRFHEDFIYDFCIVLLASGIISARLLYIILNWGSFKDNLLEIFMLSHGGLIWYGGLAGATLCGCLFIKWKKQSILKIFDLFVPYVALAQSIGRIGCFFNGCCHGKESEFGIYFPVHEQILFPSQLFDSLTLLLIFAVLKFSENKSKKGDIFCAYLMLASLQRFLMEFMRGDVRPFYHGFSIFQWMSLGMFIFGLFFYSLLIWKRKRV